MLLEHATWPAAPGAKTGGNSVEHGIYEISDLMRKGKFKFFIGLVDLFSEFRQYHRDENGKIAKSEFKSTWQSPNGPLQYHRVTFEGDDTVYEIASKDKNPDFLAVGQTLVYEVPDSSKPNKIKRAKEAPPSFSGGGGYKPDVSVITVGASINCAVTLIANGKVELKDLEATAKRIVEISVNRKDEFAGRCLSYMTLKH